MKTETNPLSGPDPLVSITDLAEYLGVPVKTIYKWRQSGVTETSQRWDYPTALSWARTAGE